MEKHYVFAYLSLGASELPDFWAKSQAQNLATELHIKKCVPSEWYIIDERMTGHKN